MPNRILREGIITSPRVCKLGWAEEVFYRRLHSVVDDFGRYYADPGMLRAACYPRQLSKVSDSDIGKWLTALVEAALVRVYPAKDGERYLEVLDFRQQVRAKESKFPAPASECAASATQVLRKVEASAPVFVFGDVDVSVDEESGAGALHAAPPPSVFDWADSGDKRLTPIPDSWELPEEWGADGEELGWKPHDILSQSVKFRLYWSKGKGAGKRRTVKGWRQSWVNWLSKAERMAA